MKQISQREIIMEYYKANPGRDIPHPDVVDWAVHEYNARTGGVFRDPDRQIRKLHQTGFLVKVDKGVYRYDPESVSKRILEEFTPAQKQTILHRDGFQCVICGARKADGIELHVDHIKSKDKGGKAIVSNGQTLCATHNFRKKNYEQTETGKKMFIRLYDAAREIGDEEIENFCVEILEVFEKNDVNGHIKWKK